MFSFPLLQGNATTVLNNANNIVLTQQLATKLFGSDDPINKIITTPTGDNFIITGILKDLPENTRFKFEYLLSWEYLQANGRSAGNWTNLNSNTFIQLFPGTRIEAFNKKIEDLAARNNSRLSKQQISLYPFSREHLYGKFVNGNPAGGNIENFRMLGVLVAAGAAAIAIALCTIAFQTIKAAIANPVNSLRAE